MTNQQIHCNLISAILSIKVNYTSLLKPLFKKQFMAPFYGCGSTLSRLQNHYVEIFYFLPLSPQIPSNCDECIISLIAYVERLTIKLQIYYFNKIVDNV